MLTIFEDSSFTKLYLKKKKKSVYNYIYEFFILITSKNVTIQFPRPSLDGIAAMRFMDILVL